MDATFELPNEDTEIDFFECLCCIQLKDLHLEIGDKLEMVYDFGCDQTFDIEVTDISPMPRGAGRSYPKIIDGAGLGILEDVSAYETLNIIKSIDKKRKI